jgi:hypothetical protein
MGDNEATTSRYYIKELGPNTGQAWFAGRLASKKYWSCCYPRCELMDMNDELEESGLWISEDNRPMQVTREQLKNLRTLI